MNPEEAPFTKAAEAQARNLARTYLPYAIRIIDFLICSFLSLLLTACYLGWNHFFPS
jgi:hypothetical protein